MNAPGHFDFYTFVLFVHIASAVIAFGAVFVYPVVDVAVRRGDLRALPVWHEAQNQIGFKLITPGATLALVTGIYMAADRWSHAGGFWYGAAGAILLAILGLSHGYFTPRARRMREQASADLAAGAAERGRMSAEYEALGAQVRIVGIATSLLVLVALLLMVWKPGA